MSETSTTHKTKIVSGDAATLGRRYAGALYELAGEQHQIDTVTTDLRMVRVLLQDSAEFQMIAAHPRLNRKQLVQAMQAVSATANFNKLTANFLALVAQNRRLNVLDAVIESYLSLLAAERGEHTADVNSTHALTPAQQELLSAKLRDIVGGKVFLSLREDKSLLGGFTVKLGSRFIDASIKTKLDRLERQLKATQTAA